jgi:hypothetical protein
MVVRATKDQGVCAAEFHAVILMTRRWRNIEVELRRAGNRNLMSNEWYARPGLLVADMDRSVDFYGEQHDLYDSDRNTGHLCGHEFSRSNAASDYLVRSKTH